MATMTVNIKAYANGAEEAVQIIKIFADKEFAKSQDITFVLNLTIESNFLEK